MTIEEAILSAISDHSRWGGSPDTIQVSEATFRTLYKVAGYSDAEITAIIESLPNED